MEFDNEFVTYITQSRKLLKDIVSELLQLQQYNHNQASLNEMLDTKGSLAPESPTLDMTLNTYIAESHELIRELECAISYLGQENKEQEGLIVISNSAQSLVRRSHAMLDVFRQVNIKPRIKHRSLQSVTRGEQYESL